MKKQTLFDLASMPKMILCITLIVMLGLLFGATSYLLKTPKIDLPIVNPVVETQCETDSDCMLVNIGSNICSCDTSLEEYKCFSLEKATKIKNEQKKGNAHVQCAECFGGPQHTCECKNGKCEKVKIEAVEEVVITTDKMEYEQGEIVEITIKNNSDKEQKIKYPPYVVENFENNGWIEIRQTWCPCGAFCYRGLDPFFIKSKDKLEYKWDQQESWCSGPQFSTEAVSIQVSAGKYRVKGIKIELNNADNKQTIYSNEFTIKEKSALDARCGEKVMGIGLCKRSAIGYEFDSNLEKCVEKRVGGCSFEIPFETLEECREVCEGKENVTLPNNNELIKCGSNSDCVLVDNDWCDCSMGGRTTCINKKYLEDWNQKLKLDHKNSINCPAVYLCDYNFTGCECVNNACQGTGGDFLNMVSELKSN